MEGSNFHLPLAEQAEHIALHQVLKPGELAALLRHPEPLPVRALLKEPEFDVHPEHPDRQAQQPILPEIGQIPVRQLPARA